MVEKEIINKTLTNAIIKCTGVYANLNKVLPSIVDNDNELHLLKSSISSFYKHYRNKTYELLETRDYDNNVITVTNHEEGSVDWDDNVISKGEKEGILYSIHNHPNSTTLMSSADFNRLCQTNCKYSITVSSDGVMIVKNTHPLEVFNRDNILKDKFFMATERGYNSFMYNMLDDFENSYYTEIEKIKTKYNYNDFEQFDNNPELQDAYFNDKEKLLTKYCKDNMDSILNSLQDNLDNRVKGLEIIHIPKTTIKEI